MRWMFLHELANLGLCLLILALPYLLVRWTRGRLIPSIVMLLYTVLAVVLSAFIYHEGHGYGPYLMITVFYFPAFMLYGWIVASLSRWWVLRRTQQAAASPGPAHRFGRQ